MSSFFSSKKYDVFVSFRGEDTRRNFTSHLHSALCQAGIKTFIDDGNLPKGHEVWPALSQAIHSSHIAIIVFSENYASSKWCLEELVKILECRKSSAGQVVIPVFYEVDPSDIRNQSGSYEEAFYEHERVLREKTNDNEYVQKRLIKWKTALTEAANISGWDSRSRDYKNEFQVVQQIVEDALQKLHLRYPPELKVEGLVGIDRIHESFESLLSRNKHNQLLKNVKVIGVWGMGGIGKTTLAKAVFSQFFPQYDSVCFLENIREESKRLGLTTLRDKLIFDLLKDENPNSNCVGSSFNARRLCSKKVFIVLDDVDSLHQLDDLCEVYKYASQGSILILTTRDRHLLVGRVDEIYEAKILSVDKLLELFCLHGFKQRCPQVGYEDLSNTVVDYACGIPLTLKVLGSNLYGRSIEFWDNELKKLKNYHVKSIESVLRVSYDGLDVPQKKLFLDIAFFFKGEDKSFVETILNACDLFATSGMKVLEDKALITIAYGNRIQMHDLLQDMGLNIIEDNLGKRTRLRDIEEGSDAVEGIALDLSHIGNLLRFDADAFNMMTKLRILKLYIPRGIRSGKVKYPRAFNKISDNLRYLEWHEYGLKSLPATFSAKMLVKIRMPHSHVTKLWQGVQDVVNLEVIDLSGCKQLKKLPDLSKASKLKMVDLTYCESLLIVHPSALSLDTLKTLVLFGCKKLKNLKSGKHLRSLQELNFIGCTSLKEFSISSDKITSLDLRETRIEKLDLSLGIQRSLETLYVEGSRLRSFPNCKLGTSRTDLRISNCGSLMDKQKLHVLFQGLTGLHYLYLTDCCKMSELPDNISNLSNLYRLILDGSSVKQLPESFKKLCKLQILSLKNCKKLCYIHELPPNLYDLNATNCSSLVKISSFKFLSTSMPMNDRDKWFENCTKLDERCVMEDILLPMMITFSHNEYGRTMRKFCYNHVHVCLAGSRVPMQFTNRKIGPTITMTLSSKPEMGIILCAVLSPSKKLKKQHNTRVWCQCYSADGRKLGHASSRHREVITDLDSDHVFIWYDHHHLDSIDTALRDFQLHHHQDLQLSFKFYVATQKQSNLLDFCVKECGIHPLYESQDLSRRVRELNELGGKYRT